MASSRRLVWLPGVENITGVQAQDDLEDKIKEQVKKWSRVKVATKEKLARHLFPEDFRNEWVDLFIKYNTPLPSSASVERMFSFGSDILRPKRATLRSPNFENLVFMKVNLNIIKKQLKQENEDERDDKLV